MSPRNAPSEPYSIGRSSRSALLDDQQPTLVEPDHSVTPAPLCEKVISSKLGVLVQGASNHGPSAQINYYDL